jgi:hypothetical protein
MDCKTARLLLEFARPGSPELDAGEAEALRQHLGDCSDCGALAAAENRADEQLGRAMRAVSVPAGLRQRLLTRVAAARPAWHRRWLVRGVAAAAAVVLLGGFGYWLLSGSPAAVSPAEIRRLADHQGSTKEDITKGFEEHFGVEVVLPDHLNYTLLDSYGLQVIQGRQVPYVLLFAPGGKRDDPPAALAQVYILSSGQFDLDETFKAINSLSPGSRYSFEATFSKDKDPLYLIFYKGQFDRFQQQNLKRT